MGKLYVMMRRFFSCHASSSCYCPAIHCPLFWLTSKAVARQATIWFTTNCSPPINSPLPPVLLPPPPLPMHGWTDVPKRGVRCGPRVDQDYSLALHFQCKARVDPCTGVCTGVGRPRVDYSVHSPKSDISCRPPALLPTSTTTLHLGKRCTSCSTKSV